MRLRVLVSVLFAAVFLAHHAFSASVPVSNGGFELPALADGVSQVGIGSPWVVTKASGAGSPLTENPAGVGAGVVEGEQRGVIFTNSLGGGTILRQVLPVTFAANTVYVFAITPLSTPSAGGTVQISIPGRTVKNVTSFGTEVSVATAFLPGDPDIGKDFEIMVSLSGTPIGGTRSVAFDGAKAFALPIPEPSVAILTGLGLLVLTGVRKPYRT